MPEKKHKDCYILFFCTLMLLTTCSSILFAGVKEPGFTNPEQTMEMDKAWTEKPIEYEQWSQGADLVVTLDQHLYPALAPLIDRYKRQKKIKIITREGTCGISAGLIAKKQVDIGGFCCPPGLTDRLPDLQYHTLGITPLSILINKKNPISNLDAETVRDIFQGKINNWSHLLQTTPPAINSTPIRPVGRLHCKLRPGHWRLLLDNEDLFAPLLHEVGTIKDMIHTVAENPEAIGFEVSWNIQRYNKTDKVKQLHINGASPQDTDQLLCNTYPFYRVYNITSWKNGSTAENIYSENFINFLISHADEIGEEFNVVPAKSLRKAGWKFKKDELIGSKQFNCK